MLQNGPRRLLALVFILKRMKKKDLIVIFKENGADRGTCAGRSILVLENRGPNNVDLQVGDNIGDLCGPNRPRKCCVVLI